MQDISTAEGRLCRVRHWDSLVKSSWGPWVSVPPWAVLMAVGPVCGASVPPGSLESHWVIRKAPLSLLSRGSIFNSEEKKMTSLFLGRMKIYGAAGFQAAAPAGHRSDDARLRRAARAAGPWWCMAARDHPSDVRAPQLPHLARLSTRAASPGSKHTLSSHCTPTITTFTTYVLQLVGARKEMLVADSSAGASEDFCR